MNTPGRMRAAPGRPTLAAMTSVPDDAPLPEPAKGRPVNVNAAPPPRPSPGQAREGFKRLLGWNPDTDPADWQAVCYPTELAEAVRGWAQWKRDEVVSGDYAAPPVLPVRIQASNKGQPVTHQGRAVLAVAPAIDLCNQLYAAGVSVDAIETEAQVAVRQVSAQTVGYPGQKPEPVA